MLLIYFQMQTYLTYHPNIDLQVVPRPITHGMAWSVGRIIMRLRQLIVIGILARIRRLKVLH